MSLVVENLDLYYGPVQALRGLSLEVDDGERVALLGANGAGKTSTLRAISGLVAPRAGEIIFDGDRIDGEPPWEVVRRGIAHLPEGRDLFAELSVHDNLKMGYWPLRGDKSKLASRVDAVMDMFPILRERSGQAAGTLSGGEQQMLGVARGLMSSPRLFIIDEVSLGLAPQITQQIFDTLAEINTEGTAVLLVEQFVHMALGGTDRAYVLAKGEVVLEGRSRELLDDPALISSYLGSAESDGSSPSSRRSRRPARAGRRDS